MIENNHMRRLVFAILTVGVSFAITSAIATTGDVDRILVFLLVMLAIMLGYGYGIFTMISKFGRQIKEATKR
jgi:hypothetical protein